MSRSAYLLLLGLVGIGRLLELRVSARHQTALKAKGASRIREPHFPVMVAIHVGTLISAAAEVWVLRRPFIPPLAVAMACIFIFANGLRWWVIHTLGGHWNVQVMNAVGLGVVSSGPYRWVRHPNYVAVVLELFSLPMIYTAWITAIWVTITDLWVLHLRLKTEDPVLLANPQYRSQMAWKPRFLPKLF